MFDGCCQVRLDWAVQKDRRGSLVALDLLVHLGLQETRVGRVRQGSRAVVAGPVGLALQALLVTLDLTGRLASQESAGPLVSQAVSAASVNPDLQALLGSQEHVEQLEELA